jgi:acyl carrier protein
MYAEKVREIVAQHGRLAAPVTDLNDESDLYNAGLTSLATVGLMLALEDAFEIEFPDSMLSRKTFGSIASLADAVRQLRDLTSKQAVA